MVVGLVVCYWWVGCSCCVLIMLWFTMGFGIAGIVVVWQFSSFVWVVCVAFAFGFVFCVIKLCLWVLVVGCGWLVASGCLLVLWLLRLLGVWD